MFARNDLCMALCPALSTQTLLDLPVNQLSPHAQLMGHCYAAEAQVALGNAAEAEGHLGAAVKHGDGSARACACVCVFIYVSA